MDEDLTQECLQLADELLQASLRREPMERSRLTCAARTASRLAWLAENPDAVDSGYLHKAVDLLRPGIHRALRPGAVDAANVYGDLARTHAERARRQRREEEG